ncbi:PhzF family phenazine biosynthesis protein [Rhizobium oryziradicis]|uniref:PhzF family phenazine biosynthesis protein n=1 Tax=Rhizobium oryziradicis TaxID=1867956 RepID=A0A1Q8ZQ21_9HYPH|nr:PhzF family phenazine biosynthesis protein [Rhizobium oryziradicis]OLP44088.1 PhzF family phenazine biosynthesis protein [Rhizobium oryziradicis]
MNAIPFVILDVFTTERFRGNPLAVILDGRDISSDHMQAIAAEFGYSETSFVLPAQNPANTAEVRIFTPVAEVPFAGHPNVGTAIALAEQGVLFGKTLSDEMRFEEKAGLVTVRLERKGDQPLRATIRAPQALTLGAEVAVSSLARAMTLAESDIVTTCHMPAFVSVGLKFIVAELVDLAALGRAKPDLSALGDLVKDYADQQTDGSTFLYCRVAEGHIRARMFAPFDNVPEDPATGSASAALVAYLTQLRPEADFSQTMLVEQGVEMGRRSLVTIHAQKRGGLVETVDISGEAVCVMKGQILR